MIKEAPKELWIRKGIDNRTARPSEQIVEIDDIRGPTPYYSVADTGWFDPHWFGGWFGPTEDNT
jgi:hypothetical protein